MDFFTNQEAARKRTGVLILYFVLAVVLIILAIYTAFVGLFIGFRAQTKTDLMPVEIFFHPEAFAGVALLTLLLVGAGSLFKVMSLRGGGDRVAQMLGGRRVQPNTRDFKEKQLYNVVEEMAIASGISTPPVYIMENEKAINAFAAGYNPDDAVIGVTRGTVDILNRDELQGVIAHEFSHILNGDMRLNIKLMGLLFGILLIGVIGQTILRGAVYSSGRSRSDKKGGGGAIIIFGLALFVIGYIGIFFGKLIKSAVSRQREFLADASAVQFTRNPLGIAGALKKIGVVVRGSVIEHPKAEEASHMFFGNGLAKSWFHMLATHPSLEERILRIDPSFDGTFPEVTPEGNAKQPKIEEKKKKENTLGAGGVPIPIPLPVPVPEIMQLPLLAAVAASPEEVLEVIGTPLKEHMDAARQMLDALPEAVRDAAHEPFGARAVLYAMLLDRDESVRSDQLARLKSHADPQVYEETQKMASAVAGLERETRLPVVNLVIGTLKALSPEQYAVFKENVNVLVEADASIDLFEYTVRHIIVRHLDAHFEGPRRKTVQYYSLKGVARDCSRALSLLARLGHEDEQEAEEAFQHATPYLQDDSAPFEFLAKDECTLGVVDKTLNRLALVSPNLKKWIVVACFQCLLHDKKITAEEAELFRAITDALDCPVPPWLGVAAVGPSDQ
jgi:Zn-dependent protease with chaperone function